MIRRPLEPHYQETWSGLSGQETQPLNLAMPFCVLLHRYDPQQLMMDSPVFRTMVDWVVAHVGRIVAPNPSSCDRQRRFARAVLNALAEDSLLLIRQSVSLLMWNQTSAVTSGCAER